MDFSLFETEYLFDLYLSGLISDDNILEFYMELVKRNASFFPFFEEIGERVACILARMDDLNRMTAQLMEESEQRGMGETTERVSGAMERCEDKNFNNYNTASSSRLPVVEAESKLTQDSLASTSRIDDTVQNKPLKYLKVHSEGERFFKRFGVTGRTIAFNFVDVNDSNPESFVKNALTELLDVGLHNIDSNDYVGLVFTTQSSIDRPVAISFRKKSQLSADAVLNVVAAVQQSNATFFAADRTILNVHSVSLPRGSGRNYGNTRLEHNLYMAKKTQSILRVFNNDSMCLAYALSLAIAFKTNSPEYKKMCNDPPFLRQRAKELCRAARLDLSDGATYEHIRDFQEYLVDYTIVVYNNRQGKSTYYEGPRSANRIVLNLMFDNNHFDVIKSLTGAFCCSYFCEVCKKPYSNLIYHIRCPLKCPCCLESPRCPETQDTIHCDKCNRDFKGRLCEQNHQRRVCSVLKRCDKCLETIYIKKKEKHECDKKYCRICKEKKSINHECYMPCDILTPKKREDRKKFLFVFYDVESRQETKYASCKGYLHEPNLVVSQQVCATCINNDNMREPCVNCGVRQRIFKGNNSIENFLNYVAEMDNLKKFNIMTVAHNMRGYDGCFILRGILTDIGRWNPKILRRGSKILQISCGESLKFLDSLNYIPLPLSKFPATFGFDGAKGYFPHLFNTLENQNYIGPLPDVSFYDPNSMKGSDRVKFLKWYKEQKSKNVIFNMADDIVKYCIMDVDILRKACIMFRECFITANDLDPFYESCTIPSACNKVFRRKFLKPYTIGIMPKGGYRLADRQSRIALKWLFWLEHSLNINIQHAGNGREFRVRGNIPVDGYCAESNTVFQFLGCYFHSCYTCYPNQVQSFENDDEDNNLMYLRREKTDAINKIIVDAGYNLVVKWECDFRREIRANLELKNFIDEHVDLFVDETINPREGFFGGRTNAVKLFHQVTGDEKIYYLDICSLYPYVNKHKKYPVGHPKITVGEAECSSKIDVNTVEGIIKCTVLPPRGLYHPVLPYRCDGKLTFPLCRTCVQSQYQEDCAHDEDERKFTGVFVADELRKGLAKGYKILSINEVWEYKIEQYDPERKTGGLLTGYINSFLKDKVLNSGFPSGCNTEAERRRYAAEYWDREGIQLNESEITYNAGKRYISKTMLNSFWGRFGQRENLKQSSIIYEPREFFKLLTDPDIVVDDIVIFDDNALLATWTRADEAVIPSSTVSVAIAAYTTSNARLTLYEYLEKLDRRVLYFDTDSVIFTHQPGEWMPETGGFLGQMTDELAEYGAGSFITTFVSTGPKSYAFNVYAPNRECDCRKDCLPDCADALCTGECSVNTICIGACKNRSVCKVKGITLNYKNSKIINFESMCEMILSGEETTLSVRNDRKIVRTPRYELVSRPEEKIFRVNYTKRRRLYNSYDTVPYGF